MDDEWLKPKIRLIGTGFLGKLECNCQGVEEVFFSSEEKNIGAKANTCKSDNNNKARLSVDGPRFPQLLFMIKLLGAFGSRRDLKNLKQVSRLYYKLLNPIYLDIVGTVLSIGGRDGLRSFEDGDEIWMSGTKGKHSFECGIPPRTWNPELAYMFRKIIAPHNLLWYGQPDLQYDGIHLNSIISQILPYITILDFPRLPYFDPNLPNFINQFPELIQLNIDLASYFGRTETEMMSKLTALKMLLQNLQKKTFHIKLRVGSNYWPILETFGNLNGITTEIYIGDKPESNQVRTFEHLSDKSAKWRNIKFISLNFNISVNSISSDLLSITSRYVKHQDQIQNCHLFFQEFPLDHNSSEESTIQQCLTKLSPILSNLHLWKINQWNVFCRDSRTIWQNLQFLHIIGFQYQLEFLKGSSTSSSFPALASLFLYNIDQDVCIFHDSEKPHEEALLTYFGNIPKLTFLDISCKDGTIDRLNEKPELLSPLKELRPQLKVESFYGSSGFPLPLNQKYSIHSY